MYARETSPLAALPRAATVFAEARPVAFWLFAVTAKLKKSMASVWSGQGEVALLTERHTYTSAVSPGSRATLLTGLGSLPVALRKKIPKVFWSNVVGW